MRSFVAAPGAAHRWAATQGEMWTGSLLLRPRQCPNRVKLGRASPSQTCPLLPQLQKSGTTSPPIFAGLRTERVVRLTSDGVEALDHFSTICKVHILFDHLIECVVRRSGGPPIAEVRGNR